MVDCREQVVGIVTRKDVQPEILGERVARRDAKREEELDATQRAIEAEKLEAERRLEQQEQQQEQRRQQAAGEPPASPEGPRRSSSSAVAPRIVICNRDGSGNIVVSSVSNLGRV